MLCVNTETYNRRLTDIESAMGCDAGPTLNRNWVGRPISYTIVEIRAAIIEWMLASTGDGDGRNKH